MSYRAHCNRCRCILCDDLTENTSSGFLRKSHNRQNSYCCDPNILHRIFQRQYCWLDDTLWSLWKDHTEHSVGPWRRQGLLRRRGHRFTLGPLLQGGAYCLVSQSPSQKSHHDTGLDVRIRIGQVISQDWKPSREVSFNAISNLHDRSHTHLVIITSKLLGNFATCQLFSSVPSRPRGQSKTQSVHLTRINACPR